MRHYAMSVGKEFGVGGVSAYNPIQLLLLLALAVVVLAFLAIGIYALIALLQRQRNREPK